MDSEEKMFWKFRLYNVDYILLGTFEYSINCQIVFEELTFSPDGHYMCLFDQLSLFIAHFPNGFYHDLFIKPALGKAALDLMMQSYIGFEFHINIDESKVEEDYQ